MNKIKKILLVVVVIFPPSLIFSLGGGGLGTPYLPDYREIQLRFTDLYEHGSLGYALNDVNYVDVREPTHVFFENNTGEMDVSKLLNDNYGVNNRGAATYYYMHGTNGLFYCMDEDNANQTYIDTNDPTNNSVILPVDINWGQTIWAQVMSQCHSNPNNTTSVNGRGFWYKSERYYSSNQLIERAATGIDLEFVFQDVTQCSDYTNQTYGCDSWDLGSTPN